MLVLPLKTENEDKTKESIDWEFLRRIHAETHSKLGLVTDEDRAGFEFNENDYKDAVIMPWYRNQDQPQYFYVAEICQHLNPTSDFPGQGFESFEKYYKSKYSINIQNLTQPLLDVDHTSARLNFLTPRYVNRKGVALPTSSEETKKNKRENLDQKQILVPELCAIHPFPASLWRQTVCLPCILYRLNGLLIADQLRASVSIEAKFGVSTLDKSFQWPALTFGWTLADVLKNRSATTTAKTEDKVPKISPVKHKKSTGSTQKDASSSEVEEGETDELGSLTNKLLNKLNEEETKLKQKSSLEIGTWSNEMAKDSIKNQENEDDFEEMDMFDPNIALPDNLTFLDSSILPSLNSKGGKDWGTGIAQRPFRVGSPTFFSNPNINIPGLIDDFDRFSCSDMSDDDREEVATPKDGEDIGNVRIEFHGDNIAEAIEDEMHKKKRVENLEKDIEEVNQMVESLPWVWEDLEVESEDFKVELKATKDRISSVNSFVLESSTVFDKVKPELQQTSVETTSSSRADNENELCQSFQDQLSLGVANVVSDDQPVVRENHGVLKKSDDSEFSFSFDLQPDLATHEGPSPSLILQSLTMSNSNDAINLERLETIGDSFLKYATTSYLFCVNTSVHEGRLSHLRSKYVSNLNLYRLGKKKGLGQFMIATKFEPHDNWLPPCYHVPREMEQALIQSGVPSTHWNVAEWPNLRDLTCEQICNLVREKSNVDTSSTSDEKIPSFIPYNLLTQHSIPDKSIADCVEALIGAYLIACGPRGALLFMNWLGLDLLTKTEDCSLPSPLFDDVPNPRGQLNVLLNGYEEFEDLIGYRFRDRSYLLQAFAHASYYPNRLTDCYQRLEFLGDAVLDYLITRHLFEDKRQHSPGALTDLRSALVNNTIFASLAVKFNFHKYFKHFSPGLQQVINRFVRIQKEDDSVLAENFYLVGEDDPEETEDIEVPKALGDIFESVAGAIYLDSNLQLDPVWTVYYRMMKPEIDTYISNVPKSPIRELLELEPETAKFGKPEKLADGRRVRVSVEVFGKGVYKGIGRNYRIAKCTAAKCALRAIKKQSEKS